MAGLHHENDHRHDEESCGQHDPAFKDVFVPFRAGEQDSNANAADRRGNQGCIDGFAQIIALNLGQVGQGNANDQSGFDAFAQGHDKSLEHLEKVPSLIATQLQLELLTG